MARTKNIAWWLAPAVLVVLFDAWLAIRELVGGSLLGDVDAARTSGSAPRQSGSSSPSRTRWGWRSNRRRPALAGVLILVGSVPAAQLIWSPAVMVVGLASCVGAIYHVAKVGPQPDRVRA